MRRVLRGAAVGVLVFVALALLFLALPVRIWRTGELPVPPLPLLPPDSISRPPPRIWIDTDAACGTGRRVDPDDCFAILLLAADPGLDLVGISTVFGNAPLETTDSVTREVASLLSRARGRPIPVFRGAAAPGPIAPTPAEAAIRSALAAGPLTIVALGPLTNLAGALEGGPAPPPGLARVVAVMGRHPGHLFHPAEGAGGGMLLGHGPVFRDFNVAADRPAATAVLRRRLPLLLVPYEAARQIELTAADLDRLAAGGEPGRWVARRGRAWLDFWRRDVGRAGFYPFDLMAALQVADPSVLRCARVTAWMGRDPTVHWPWLREPALLVTRDASGMDSRAVSAPALYCPAIAADAGARLRSLLRGEVDRGIAPGEELDRRPSHRP